MLLEEIKQRNFVAKNAQSKSGAGAHVTKKGKKAPRHKQKKQWKKEVRELNY